MKPRRPPPSAHGLVTAVAVCLGLTLLALARPNPVAAGDPDSVLARHVDAEALRLWRAAASAELRSAFDHLFSWLPPSDLAAWRADAVIGDLELALATRRESPWAEQIPPEIFRTWVLPHRVAQEPVQPWRRTLHDLLWPRVRALPLREAILETNRFCREHATFTPTSARDQGPLTTMARGLGRCEEETIFFVCAARSVGIPARVAWTPWWMAGDGNHAWVEAWDGTGWHYLGACEPATDLDQAWFTEPARRAGLVVSGAYGEDAPADGILYRRGLGVSLVNSTEVYSTPGTLRVEWEDLTTEARASRDTVRVTAHVWNHGTLRPLAEFAAGDSIPLGPADYFVSCAVDGSPAAGFARIEPGGRTLLRLDPRNGEAGLRALLAAPFRLRIPTPAPRPASGTPPDEAATVRRAERLRAWEDSLVTAHRSRMREDSLRRVAPTRALLARDPERGTRILEQLSVVPPMMSRWLSFALATPEDEWRTTADYLLALDDKDLLEVDTTSARGWIRECRAVRARRARAGYVLPDSLWATCVLSPRIDRQCDDADWRHGLPWLGSEENLPDGPQLLAAFAARVHHAPSTQLGPIATPSQTWRSGWATPASARVGLVGLLRRHGLAARVEIGHRWVEVYGTDRWVPCDPFDGASWDRKPSTVAPAYEAPAHLSARFLEGDSVFAEAEPWQHFLLARFRNGRFEPDDDADHPVDHGHLERDIEPGSWWLFAGLRDRDGSPTIVVHPFTADAGTRVDRTIRVEDPAGGTREPAAPEAPDAPEGSPGDCGGTAWTAALRDLAATVDTLSRPHLIAIWDPRAEPSERVRRALSAEVVPGGFPPPLVSFAVSFPGEPLDRSLEDAHAVSTLRPLPPAELARRFGADARAELPYLLLVDADGTPHLCLSGLRGDAPDQIRRALRDISNRSAGRAR